MLVRIEANGKRTIGRFVGGEMTFSFPQELVRDVGSEVQILKSQKCKIKKVPEVTSLFIVRDAQEDLKNMTNRASPNAKVPANGLWLLLPEIHLPASLDLESSNTECIIVSSGFYHSRPLRCANDSQICVFSMYSPAEIVTELTILGVSHVVWVPDSMIGRWEKALDASPEIELVRVCREGEAWPLAAGLLVGGKSPLVMMQTTGLFESGDAMRNAVFDMQLPVFALIGARNWLNATSNDSARRYTEPILRAWSLDYVVVEKRDDKLKLAEHYEKCQKAHKPGFVILAE